MKNKKHKIKIEIPKGYEYVRETKSVDEDGGLISVELKRIEKPLPATWEELEKIEGYYHNLDSHICHVRANTESRNKNVWPTEELAEAALALSQLSQLRDVYNDGWKPDWKGNSCKWIIFFYLGGIGMGHTTNSSSVLAFRNFKLRDEFRSNFAELIETAKPLL